MLCNESKIKNMIIGMIGYAQTGKSTCARYLEDNYGFVRHNMKDALVKEIKENFPDLLDAIGVGYGYSQANGSIGIVGIARLFIEKPPIMRALMQNYGTEVRRKDNPNYWTEQWGNSLPEGNTVVDDVRFLNEAQAVKEKDGILIRITRPDITTGGSHTSETEHDGIVADYTIETTKGDIEGLHKQLDAILLEERHVTSTWSEGINMDSKD